VQKGLLKATAVNINAFTTSNAHSRMCVPHSLETHDFASRW
jgi:hypothetical protein